MKQRIIALTGAAGSGKSTVADHLEKRGYVRVKFAGPLKDMLRAIGLTERQIEGDQKEVPCELLAGVTTRRAMQTLGTEWGRDIISPDLWVGLWRARVEQILANGAFGIIADDCRFQNEHSAVRALGGDVWRIIRPSFVGTDLSHVSESGASSLPADVAIVNACGIPELLEMVDKTLTQRPYATIA